MAQWIPKESISKKKLVTTHYYNWHRAHGALSGKTPMGYYLEVRGYTLFREEVQATYGLGREIIRYTGYRIDLKQMKFRKKKQTPQPIAAASGRLRRVTV